MIINFAKLFSRSFYTICSQVHINTNVNKYLLFKNVETSAPHIVAFVGNQACQEPKFFRIPLRALSRKKPGTPRRKCLTFRQRPIMHAKVARSELHCAERVNKESTPCSTATQPIRSKRRRSARTSCTTV